MDLKKSERWASIQIHAVKKRSKSLRSCRWSKWQLRVAGATRVSFFTLGDELQNVLPMQTESNLIIHLTFQNVLKRPHCTTSPSYSYIYNLQFCRRRCLAKERVFFKSGNLESERMVASLKSQPGDQHVLASNCQTLIHVKICQDVRNQNFCVDVHWCYALSMVYRWFIDG